MHPLQQFAYCPRCGSYRFVENDASSKRCESCGFVYYLNPKAAVAAFVFDSESRLLVCRRAFEPGRGMLDLPGGFTECGETAEEAVARELYEEVGLTAERISYLFSYPNIYRYSGFDVHTMDLFFRCEVNTQEGEAVARDDVSQCLWLRRDEICIEDFAFESIRKAVKSILTADELG